MIRAFHKPYNGSAKHQKSRVRKEKEHKKRIVYGSDAIVIGYFFTKMFIKRQVCLSKVRLKI